MFKFFNRIIFGTDPFARGFEISPRLQHEFISKLKEPENILDRSYNQYLCQRFIYKKSLVERFAFNCAAFFILPFFLFYNLFKGLFVPNDSVSLNRAVFPYEGKYDKIIPDDYYDKYQIIETPFLKGSALCLTGFNLVVKLFLKYGFSPFFVFKCAVKIASYSYLVKKYNTAAIFSSVEYSFTSSVLTAFCREKKVKHINVMHGEKLYSIIDSWFEFDEFSVWDIHYVNLFSQLKASPNQFLVNVPQALKLSLNDSIDKKYYLTYYLAGESEEILLKIKAAIDRLKRKDICLRLHPRYSDENLIKKIFSDFTIENPSKISLKESFETTERVVSLFSTVLYQGYLNNKTVVIDDLSHAEEKIQELKDYKYIMFEKHIYYLSELV